jgi:hypothetical protein
MKFKKINNTQWVTEKKLNSTQYGIEKVAINDEETKFRWLLCEVTEQYGCLQFDAFDTFYRLKDAKEYM